MDKKPILNGKQIDSYSKKEIKKKKKEEKASKIEASKAEKNLRITTRDIAEVAMLTAIIYVLTRINVPLPISVNGGGLMHLGNIGLVIAAIIFGKWQGAVAASVGMALFDVTAGYFVWAPFTFVIRFMMGYSIGLIAYKFKKIEPINLILAILVGGAIMVVGYFITSVILFGDVKAAFINSIGDIVQVIIAFIAIPIALMLNRAYKKLLDK